MLIGIATNLTAAYINTDLVTTSLFLMLVAVLLLRPQAVRPTTDGTGLGGPHEHNDSSRVLHRRASRNERIAASVRTGRGILLPGRVGLLAVVAAVVLIAGVTGDNPLKYSLVIGTIYAIAILGNNAITGTLGEINLAAGAFMAIGAYTASYTLSRGWGLATVALAVIVVSLLLGLLIAIPTVRLSGLFTALATFAMAYAVPDLALALSSITGGDAGTAITPPIIGDTLIDGPRRSC